MSQTFYVRDNSTRKVYTISVDNNACVRDICLQYARLSGVNYYLRAFGFGQSCHLVPFDVPITYLPYEYKETIIEAYDVFEEFDNI